MVTHVTASTKTPPVNTTPTIPAMPKVRLGSLGMSFQNLMKAEKKEEKEEEEIEITNKDENQSFTSQELIVEWKGMCNRIAKMNAGLAQRMKIIKPQKLADGKIEVVVGKQNPSRRNESHPWAYPCYDGAAFAQRTNRCGVAIGKG